MKRSNFILILILLNYISVLGQDTKIDNDSLYKPNYPEGIYSTKEEFIKKSPSEDIPITPKGIFGITKPVLTEIAHNCFFYNATTDVKITDVFAISYKGHLYFQIGAILKNRNKTDRSQSSDIPNSFVRVIFGGNNYLYTEAQLANAWAQGLAMGTIGGVVGATVSNSMIYGKGLVWDYKNEEFNIFKNCEDYNDFITAKNKEGIQACEKNQPDVLKIRVAVNKIK